MAACRERHGVPRLSAALSSLIRSLQAEPRLNAAKLTTAVSDAAITEHDLMAWADFEHPPEDSYGEKTIHLAGALELMARTWLPGDVSAIHNSGADVHCGCVQVFGGSLEYAKFVSDGERLQMVDCSLLPDRGTIAVGREMIHQFRNVGDTPVLSLHIHARLGTTADRVVTDRNRLFEACTGSVALVHGGAFLPVPAGAANVERTAVEADFTTWLRDLIFATRRVCRAAAADRPVGGGRSEAWLLQTLFQQPARMHARLLTELRSHVSETDHATDARWFAQLHRTVREWAALEVETETRPESATPVDGAAEAGGGDAFAEYADVYDALIGQPCLDGFMAGFIRRFFDLHVPEPAACRLLSIGCGTGVVEAHIVREQGVRAANLLAFDLSPAQAAAAQQRGLNARTGDVLRMDRDDFGEFDVAFAGLNVFQYLPAERMRDAVRNTAAVLCDDGHFFGDFIAPDHVRWYPNLIVGIGGHVVSLRIPMLVEDGCRTHQDSSIVNIDLRGERVRIKDAGTHRRHLPSMLRVRQLFEEAFGGEVKLYDAHSLDELPRDADTSPSTRYVVCAQKGGRRRD